MSTSKESESAIRRIITVAIHESGTERQIGFKEQCEAESPFHDAMSILMDYLDTICKSKPRGTTEYFTVFVMVERDNPFRVDFEVCYEPKKWRKIYKRMPKFNETGTEPYQIKWAIPEDIDAFPSLDPTSDSKSVVWTPCPQHRRFGTYKGIKDTVANRVRCRLNRRLKFEESVSPLFPPNDEPQWEPIDLAQQIAKGASNQDVAKWLLDLEYKRGGGLSMRAATELVDLMRMACSREISILTAIYGMERAQASCADIVAEAKQLLHVYDENAATQQPRCDQSQKT